MSSCTLPGLRTNHPSSSFQPHTSTRPPHSHASSTDHPCSLPQPTRPPHSHASSTDHPCSLPQPTRPFYYIRCSEKTAQVWQQHKHDLNFSSCSDDDFLLFLLYKAVDSLFEHRAAPEQQADRKITVLESFKKPLKVRSDILRQSLELPRRTTSNQIPGTQPSSATNPYQISPASKSDVTQKAGIAHASRCTLKRKRLVAPAPACVPGVTISR